MIPKTLTLLRGLPGSGKSTFANLITNEFSICEADKLEQMKNRFEIKL